MWEALRLDELSVHECFFHFRFFLSFSLKQANFATLIASLPSLQKNINFWSLIFESFFLFLSDRSERSSFEWFLWPFERSFSQWLVFHRFWWKLFILVGFWLFLNVFRWFLFLFDRLDRKFVEILFPIFRWHRSCFSKSESCFPVFCSNIHCWRSFDLFSWWLWFFLRSWIIWEWLFDFFWHMLIIVKKYCFEFLFYE